MVKRFEVYVCEICGNVVEVAHGGKGQLVCCRQPMDRYDEKSDDATKEIHVPVVEREGESVRVTAGSDPHPMEDGHYIEWIEAIDGNSVYRKYLNPGDEPRAVFSGVGPDASFRVYCILHGLWKG